MGVQKLSKGSGIADDRGEMWGGEENIDGNSGQ